MFHSSKVYLLNTVLRNEKGVAAVEFALIAPVFILMMAFMVHGGMYLHAHSTLVTNIREAVRGVALGYMSVDEAKVFAIDQSRDQLGINADVKIDAANPPTNPDVRGVVSVSVEEMARFSPFSNLLPFKISAAVTMRSVK